MKKKRMTLLLISVLLLGLLAGCGSTKAPVNVQSVAMITGYGEGENTGFLALDGEGRELSYSHPLLPRSYPGTGDVFSSVLVGGLVRGLSLREAGVLASDFVAGCIAATAADPQGPDYGVEFEGQLGKLLI